MGGVGHGEEANKSTSPGPSVISGRTREGAIEESVREIDSTTPVIEDSEESNTEDSQLPSPLKSTSRKRMSNPSSSKKSTPPEKRLIHESEYDVCNDEWRSLAFHEDSLSTSSNPTEFWCSVQKLKSSDGTFLFPNLAKFMLCLLVLPHSSAAVERIFSQVKLIKTDIRNKLNTESINGLLLSKDQMSLSSLRGCPYHVTIQQSQRAPYHVTIQQSQRTPYHVTIQQSQRAPYHVTIQQSQRAPYHVTIQQSQRAPYHVTIQQSQRTPYHVTIQQSQRAPYHVTIQQSQRTPYHVTIQQSQRVPYHVTIQQSQRVPYHVTIQQSQRVPLPCDHTTVSEDPLPCDHTTVSEGPLPCDHTTVSEGALTM
ncbi:hypothetical protein Pcinc_015399 [Petrolisthes cinctipes]|uniref:HAT C-terminal dimerisation domain-containing protein n=1 Tax=Petrolisthes cinctipes TaxID=88211 RepID=A0AAE1FVU4_PETCI|nr:hypothetical protein Pcinc_015399 [Petrolisthes cinctipes]